MLEREQIWWDVVLARDAARFYITLPAGEWADWARAKIERLWEGVVVSVATEEDSQLLNMGAGSAAYKLVLKRHNMFSLAVDRREETHPVGDILGVLDDLKEGEKVRFAIKLEPVERVRWQKAAESAHQRFSKGQMPKRGMAGPGEYAKDALHVLMWLLSFGIEAFAGLLPGGSKYKNPLVLQREKGGRSEVLVDGRLSRSTLEKANLPVFSCQCFVMAEGKDGTRAESLVTTVTGALSAEMDENNEWTKMRQDGSIVMKINGRQLGIASPDKTVLSTKEMGKLTQLPTAGIQDLYRRQIMSSERLSIDLPAAITGCGIPYGVAESRGQQVPIFFPTQNRDEVVKVSVFIGESGSGKTTALANRALGALEQGKSYFAYEFTKREYLQDILNALPADFPEDHIVCLDYGNRAWPIGTAWNEVQYGIHGGWEDILASEFWTFFSRYADDGVARTRRWLKKAALACAHAGCLDPLNVTLMLLSKQFREQALARVSDPVLKATWEMWEMASDSNQITMAEPIMSRLDYLLDNSALKNCICQPPKLGPGGSPLVDFRRWADGDERGPYLVLVYAPKAVFSAAGIDAMMAWLNAKEWLMTLTRPLDYDRECLVSKDEIQQFPSIVGKAEEQVVEGRKYGVGQNWSFHSWAQVEKISPHLVKILKANNPNIHLLKSDEDTYRMLRTQLAPFDVEDDLLPMERHWAVNRWHVGGKAQAFMCKLNGPPKPVKDRSYLWELHSRIYGRPAEEVSAEIATREMMLLQITEGKKRGRAQPTK